MLTLEDDRWHCDGKPIHAGNCLEIRWPDGTWELVRFESGDSGRKLFAQICYHGLDLSIRIDTDTADLRWPR